MKKTILKLTITTVIVLAGFTAFSQEDKKAAAARKDIKEAQKDLREAKTDSAADFQAFKKDAQMKINDNEKKIADLKTKKASENKDVRKKYDEKVLALTKKNNELKRKIEGSETTKTSMWSSFKREFSHDMDELGHAIKDIGVNNEK